MRRKLLNAVNHLPNEIKLLVSNTARLVPRQMIVGKTFRNTLKNIQLTERNTKDEIDSLINRRLSDIILHASVSTPFYRQQIESLNITHRDIFNSPREVLSQLPFIDKSTIRDNYSKFLSEEKSRISCDFTSTGGTSGEPFYFHINSERSEKEWAYFIDLWGRVGFNLSSRRASFRGSAIKSSSGWEDDWFTLERKFSSFELTDTYLGNVWNDICDYQPDFIYAYPSTALAISQFMERSYKKLPDSVRAILVGSENIYEGQDKTIYRTTGKRVFRWYGHAEKLVLAGECENSANYHAYPQYGYVEFINERGRKAEPGEFAEIVGTGYTNTVVPFLRYRTGDFCTYLGDHCPVCKRNYMIFKDIRGRWTQEVLYGKNGNSICMSAINVHSNNFKNVFRYQFYQETPGTALIKIMPMEKFNEGQKTAIVNEFNEKFNGNVIVSAVVVDNIPLTGRGKYKYIDQNCEINMKR